MAAGRIALKLDGRDVTVDVADGETLLSVLRERCGVTSVKDGCAPQGQCGCCTVLVDGEPRVACVTPAGRVDGRAVTTVDGLDSPVRDALAAALLATGGSQCGFCTPGILVRSAWLLQRGKTAPVDVDRALAAHLCRCTGWQTVVEAIAVAAGPQPVADEVRSLARASERAALEGGVGQRVGADIPTGAGGFAEDTAPTDALVAVPVPPGSAAGSIEAAGHQWVVAASLHTARQRAAKVQGRRTTITDRPPLPVPAPPEGGVALATSWVEPAYLEPDASWCAPGGDPASPLANGGAFGGKETSLAPTAARALADVLDRSVRVVFAREDVVRLGGKRPPMAAIAVLEGRTLSIRGDVIEQPELFKAAELFESGAPAPYDIDVAADWRGVASPPGPPVSAHARAAGWAERAVLVEGALTAANADRRVLVRDEFAAVLLDTCVVAPSGAAAGARVTIDEDSGAVARVDLALMAGDPLDVTTLRSYAIGAAHMGLGWVLTESLAVDESGEVRDLTIRSFGIIRARDVPKINVHIVDDPRPPLARASDAVFAAVAAATWNAIAIVDRDRPPSFPARASRAARAFR